MKYCRIVSESFKSKIWEDFEIDGILYSGRLPLDKADVLLALYDPTDELLIFRGPKLWYTLEPSWHYHFTGHPVGKKLVQVLRPDERAFYNNKNIEFRVPHPTYCKTLECDRRQEIQNKAVACVTNYGGRLWFLKKHIWLRNWMVLRSEVDLFGNPEKWRNFRAFPHIWLKGPPPNFLGKPPGKHQYDTEYINFLSNYKVCICLENTCEPYYFTEKFVNAVRAGCIPIYNAHETVADRFLKNAKWIDPKWFGYSAKRTIKYALSQDINDYRRINDKWLESGILADTDDSKLMERLHPLVKKKLQTCGVSK